jgi:hypothetical protein
LAQLCMLYMLAVLYSLAVLASLASSARTNIPGALSRCDKSGRSQAHDADFIGNNMDIG